MRSRRIFDKVVLVIAGLAFMLTVLEGFFYYGDLQCHNVFRILMIIKNGIGGFSFDADISITDVMEKLGENPTLIEMMVGYAYAVAVVLAPLCTVAAFCRVFEALLGWRIRLSFHEDCENILICGYNEHVSKILENNQKEQERHKGREGQNEWKKKRIWVIAGEEPADYVRQRFLSGGVTFHTADCLTCSDAELKKLFRDVKLHKIQKIILFESSSEKNFSLYYMFNSRAELLAENVKIYCSCENEGIHRILEDYYNQKFERKLELETFSLNELQVRNLFEAESLHTYYRDSQKSPHDWKVHLLVLGFGGLGQQVLLQAMNLGVSSWKNDILIDVVDQEIKKKQDIFGSHFNGAYIKMDEKEFTIPQDKVDGNLRIRFHQADVCGRGFQEFLNTAGEQDPFTYIVICMQDTRASLHALFETERFLTKQNALGRTVIGIRMDADAQMARYLAGRDPQKGSVYVIGGDIDIDSICHRKYNAMAQEYHEVYRNIQIIAEPSGHVGTRYENTGTEGWQSLSFYKQDSNRALAYHDQVKREVIASYGEERLTRYFGNKDGALRREDNVWVFCGTEQELLEWINDDAFLRDMVMLEHRRWCLFMACKGWGFKEGVKDEAVRESPCMVNWDILCRNQPDMCKYDLIPLLALYESSAHRQ